MTPTIPRGRLGVETKIYRIRCHCGIGQRFAASSREAAVEHLRQAGWEQHRRAWQCPACLAMFAVNRLNSR